LSAGWRIRSRVNVLEPYTHRPLEDCLTLFVCHDCREVFGSNGSGVRCAAIDRLPGLRTMGGTVGIVVNTNPGATRPSYLRGIQVFPGQGCGISTGPSGRSALSSSRNLLEFPVRSVVGRRFRGLSARPAIRINGNTQALARRRVGDETQPCRQDPRPAKASRRRRRIRRRLGSDRPFVSRV